MVVTTLPMRRVGDLDCRPMRCVREIRDGVRQERDVETRFQRVPAGAFDEGLRGMAC